MIISFSIAQNSGYILIRLTLELKLLALKTHKSINCKPENFFGRANLQYDQCWMGMYV